jgi:hypothetical protein
MNEVVARRGRKQMQVHCSARPCQKGQYFSKSLMLDHSSALRPLDCSCGRITWGQCAGCRIEIKDEEGRKRC